MSGWFRALFLLSSFGPLYALLAVGLWFQGAHGPAVVAATAFVSSFLLFLKLRSGFKRQSVVRNKVELIESLDENILTYLISYLPPVLIDDYSDPKKTGPLIVFYVVAVVLMLRTNTIYVNPYFLVFGYRIYRVTLTSGRPAIVVCNRPELVTGDELNLYEIESSRLYFAE